MAAYNLVRPPKMLGATACDARSPPNKRRYGRSRRASNRHTTQYRSIAITAEHKPSNHHRLLEGATGRAAGVGRQGSRPSE